MEKEVEISIEKSYKLPKFHIVEFKEYTLAIAVESAKWIVLYNKEQREILKMLAQGYTIKEVLEKYNDYQDDVTEVLTQIEAKMIETAQVKSIFSNTKLHLHLTNRCNLRCPHCYMESGTVQKDELSTEEIKTLCANFHKYGGTDISLTGGEPTVHPDFCQIVKFVSDLGIRTSIFSNGCFWDEEKVKFISKQNIDGIQISLDGYDEASNAVVRGNGAFGKALNSIDLLIKNQVNVKVAVTAPYEVLKNHQNEYIQFSKHLLNKYGSDAIQIDYSHFFMPGRNLTVEKIKAVKDEYFRLVDEVVFGIYGDISEDTFVDNIIDHCIFDSCGYGSLNVMADGDFYFCDRIPDVGKIGNIREMSFDEIYRLMKKAEDAGKIDHFKPCNQCELKYICGGGCRAEHFREFTMISNVSNIDFNCIKPRTCKREDKEKIYELMVKTNERFFC